MASNPEDARNTSGRADTGTPSNPPEEALVSTIELFDRFAQGDEHVVDLLLERQLPRLKRWAHGRLPLAARSLLDTQDLVQNVVIGALPRLRSFEPRHQGALQAFLRQAVVNEIRAEVHNARRSPAPADLSTEMLDPATSPLEQAIGREQLARYEAALARLRPADREAIVARIELQQDYGDVAVALGEPSAAAARMSVTRAMARLVEVMTTDAGPGLQAEARVPEKAEQVLHVVTSAIADAESINWDEIDELPFDAARRQRMRQLQILSDVTEANRFRMRRLAGRKDASRSEPAAGIGTWGRFVLRKRIGEGAFGEVFEAYDPSRDERVALKLAWPGIAGRGSSSRTLREAQRLARVRHPSVVAVRDASTHEDRVGFWMDFIEGHTLSEQVGAQGPLSAGEATHVGEEVCSALAAVHRAGLIHRDVKAQNVMRSTDGRIILMDFGSSELLNMPTVELRPQGTPLYLAPELFEGGSASVAADIYSVGVLLYYLVTARFPVQATSLDGLAAAHHRGERRHLASERPDLPSAFVAVVERALEKDSARRYGSAGEMLRALQDAAASYPRNVETTLPIQQGEAPRQSSTAFEFSRQTEAMITRLSARAYFSAQGQLLRSPRSRRSALTLFMNATGEKIAPGLTRLLARTLAARANESQLALTLAEAAAASFACELERGLLREPRCRFSGIGEFALTPAGVTVDVDFVSEASPVAALVRERRIDDPLCARALQQAASTAPGPLVPVTASITQRMLAGEEELFSDLGIQGLGRAVYWAFVAAISCNLEGNQSASLPHVGSFQRRGGELTFRADASFIRIIAENKG